MGRKDRRDKPAKKAGRVVHTPEVGERVNNDDEHPKFCFRYLNTDFGVHRLHKDQQVAFAQALAEKGSMPWRMLKGAPRGGQGSELIPKGKIKAPVPPKFDNHDKFMVFRYDGTLPMVGVRVADVYHLLWLERVHGDVYDHGGS